MRCAECRDVLVAYIDGELDPAESRDVRAHLGTCVECATERDVLTQSSQLLKEGLVRYPAPDVLKARIRSALAQPSEPTTDRIWSRRSWLGLAAAGLVIAASSSALTYSLTGRAGPTTSSIAREVLATHTMSLLPNHLIDVASTNQHTVKPWFNGRVDLSPQVPNLDSAGFQLVGGRLDNIDGRNAAAIIYMRRQHTISVFQWTADGPDSEGPSITSRHGYHLIHWRSDATELWTISDLNRTELEQFVSLFRQSSSANK